MVYKLTHKLINYFDFVQMTIDAAATIPIKQSTYVVTRIYMYIHMCTKINVFIVLLIFRVYWSGSILRGVSRDTAQSREPL